MEATNPKPFVFVLMPFSDDFRDIYEVGIKAACKDAGAYCERVDEQIFNENILERVYSQIAKADIIVAEMSGRNPNVFYEVGYAHGLNKHVTLLTQKAEDIPFDLKHYPHIVYGGQITTLKSQLETRLRWAIANPKEAPIHHEFNLDVLINGKEYPFTEALEVVNNHSELSQTLEIAFHNPNNYVYKGVATIGLITSSDLIVTYAKAMTSLPNNQHLYNLGKIENILPNGWFTRRYTIIYKDKLEPKGPQQTTLRIFTEFGTRDYTLTITDAPKTTRYYKQIKI